MYSFSSPISLNKNPSCLRPHHHLRALQTDSPSQRPLCPHYLALPGTLQAGQLPGKKQTQSTAPAHTMDVCHHCHTITKEKEEAQATILVLVMKATALFGQENKNHRAIGRKLLLKQTANKHRTNRKVIQSREKKHHPSPPPPCCCPV